MSEIEPASLKQEPTGRRDELPRYGAAGDTMVRKRPAALSVDAIGAFGMWAGLASVGNRHSGEPSRGTVVASQLEAILCRQIQIGCGS